MMKKTIVFIFTLCLLVCLTACGLTTYSQKTEKEAINFLKEGKTFVPTKEQTFFANLPYALDVYEELSGELAQHYMPKKSFALLNEKRDEKRR